MESTYQHIQWWLSPHSTSMLNSLNLKETEKWNLVMCLWSLGTCMFSNKEKGTYMEYDRSTVLQVCQYVIACRTVSIFNNSTGLLFYLSIHSIGDSLFYWDHSHYRGLPSPFGCELGCRILIRGHFNLEIGKTFFLIDSKYVTLINSN